MMTALRRDVPVKSTTDVRRLVSVNELSRAVAETESKLAAQRAELDETIYLAKTAGWAHGVIAKSAGRSVPFVSGALRRIRRQRRS
jgi:hypothetical protein